MEVNDQSTAKLFTPKDIVSPQVVVCYTKGSNFLVRFVYLAAKPLRQLHRRCAFASPAHYEHVADFSAP